MKMAMMMIVCYRSTTTMATAAARAAKEQNGKEDDSDGRGRCNFWGDNADIKVGGMSALPFVLLPGTAMERERG